jgi:hypothetical protein
MPYGRVLRVRSATRICTLRPMATMFKTLYGRPQEPYDRSYLHIGDTLTQTTTQICTTRHIHPPCSHNGYIIFICSWHLPGSGHCHLASPFALVETKGHWVLKLLLHLPSQLGILSTTHHLTSRDSTKQALSRGQWNQCYVVVTSKRNEWNNLSSHDAAIHSFSCVKVNKWTLGTIDSKSINRKGSPIYGQA